MDSISYKTRSLNKDEVDKEWLVVDATNQTLGRLASEVARRIRGKHKPSFTPNVDCGDNVIILNAGKVRLTGKKWDQKEYVWYTGYPGGKRVTTPRQLKEKSSVRLVEQAVKGMLPKNRLGRKLFNNLFVYEGNEHPHEAQQPKSIEL